MQTRSLILNYRLFPINDAGRITGTPDIIEATADEQAIEAARRLVGTRTAEMWSGARHVVTLNRKGLACPRIAADPT